MLMPTMTLLSAAMAVSIICVAHAVEYSSQTMKKEVDKLDFGGLSRDKFPAGFVFGTATSAYQVEGMADKGGRVLKPSGFDE
ncbi:unnamed protein product [Rhodiola kirilowii]